VPVIPNLLEKTILIDMNQAPAVMLDYLGALSFRCVCAAKKLGIFELLEKRPLSAGDLAKALNLDPRGTKFLLDALMSLGYVQAKGGTETALFRNTSQTKKWLVQGSQRSVGEGLDFFEMIAFEFFGNLEDSIKRGKPPINIYDWMNQEDSTERWRIFQEGMITVARLNLNEIISKIKLSPTVRRLLDIGGGHGLYSIEFCKKYPNLTATVLDSEQALEIAKDMISREKMDSKVSVKMGDLLKEDSLGEEYDVALLFNIIHHFSPEENLDLMRRVLRCLRQGGTIVILDGLESRISSRTAQAVARIMVGLVLFDTVGGQVYSFREISEWLESAGFVGAKKIGLRASPGVGLVVATKK
jgi:cyclopropane fatty-acyl-phospholipid synthase-like methyltransferase